MEFQTPSNFQVSGFDIFGLGSYVWVTFLSGLGLGGGLGAGGEGDLLIYFVCFVSFFRGGGGLMLWGETLFWLQTQSGNPSLSG